MNRGLAAVATLAFLGGCTFLYSSDLDKRQCKTDGDCAKLASDISNDGLFLCEANACKAVDCKVDTDCALGQTCDANSCVGGSDGGELAKACKRDTDCGTNERCSPKDNLCYSKWGCLDSERDWTNTENRKSDFEYKMLMRSLQNPDDPSLLGTLTVRACPSTDLVCASATVPDERVTKTADKHITVPFVNVGINGFVGTVRIDATVPDDQQTMTGMPKQVLPGFFQFTGENPLVNDTIGQDRAILIDTNTAAGLASLSTVGSITEASNIVFLFYDCGGNKAANMRADIKDKTGYRFVTLADEQNPSLGDEATTSYGTAIIVGAPSGFQSFIIKDVKENRVITDSFSFTVIENGINYVQYYPRYAAMKKWLDYAEKNPDAVP